MKITGIRTIPRSLPYKDADEWKIAKGPIKEASMVFVEIETDSGARGQGCTSSGAPFIGGESVAGVKYMIDEVFSKHLIGKSPYDIEDIMEQLDKAAFMNLRAKAGIDLALHDLVGKILGIPVQSYTGSSQRRPIPVMRLLGLKDPNAMAKDAAALTDQGFTALKIKLAGQRDIDLKRVRVIRGSVPDGVTLTVDMNGVYKPKAAIELIGALHPYNIALVEQPVARENIEGLAFVRERVPVQIEADESAMTLTDVARIARSGGADFIGVKLVKMGGILKAKKIAAICEAFGLDCIVHSTPGSQMVDVATGHFFLSTPNVWWAAEVGEHIRMQDDPVSGAVIKNGFLEIPQGPGFGVNVNY